jgi:uncharacterized protein YjiS (DUF1127 family)
MIDGGICKAGATAMLQQLTSYLRRKHRERATINALSELDERGLQDLGLAPGDVPRVARLAAELDRRDISIYEVVQRLDEAAAIRPAYGAHSQAWWHSLTATPIHQTETA